MINFNLTSYFSLIFNSLREVHLQRTIPDELRNTSVTVRSWVRIKNPSTQKTGRMARTNDPSWVRSRKRTKLANAAVPGLVSFLQKKMIRTASSTWMTSLTTVGQKRARHVRTHPRLLQGNLLRVVTRGSRLPCDRSWSCNHRAQSWSPKSTPQVAS